MDWLIRGLQIQPILTPKFVLSDAIMAPDSGGIPIVQSAKHANLRKNIAVFAGFATWSVTGPV